MEIIGASMGAVMIAVVLWKIVRNGIADDNGEISPPPPDAP